MTIQYTVGVGKTVHRFKMSIPVKITNVLFGFKIISETMQKLDREEIIIDAVFEISSLFI